MRTKTITLSITAILMSVNLFSMEPALKDSAVYEVVRLKGQMTIDGKWDKPQWKHVKTIDITNYMGTIPKFQPEAKAKVMYDADNIYVIFQVKDKYVRCITNEYDGPVYKDATVEFFFATDMNLPEQYFNLETNCGGTALMRYQIVPRKDYKKIDIEDFKTIELAHSLPQIIDPEIEDGVTWTIEYRIPFTMLEKYAKVTRPGKGIVWRANLYKIAENNSNPHYLTWSVVENSKPDFHLPKFFGRLIFE